MDYSIWINNNKVSVSQEVYSTYWKGVRKERYFAESDVHNHVFSYDALDNENMNGEDIFTNVLEVPIDEQVIARIEVQQLYDSLSKLSCEERYIIYQIYFCKMPLRKLSKALGIAPSTLHYRHHSILKKLYRDMNSEASLTFPAY